MRKHIILICIVAFFASMAKAQPVTVTPPSASIEPGESVTLTASGALYYTWSPATGLSTTEGPVTVASPLVTTIYTCSGYGPGVESVVNGDFSQGNVGFTSAYEYNTNLWNEGTYYVDSDASLHHENFVGHGHINNGNFMIVNGATTPGTRVWSERITVTPHTNYAFSTWVCTIGGSADQVALLQFSINGEQIGDVFSAPPSLNTWVQFYELWNSGDATTATITILNQNTGGDGNDFGLDDISFCELVLLGAPECPIYVGSLSAEDDHQEGCYGETMDIPFLDNDHLLQSCDAYSCQIIRQGAHGTAAVSGDDMTYTPYQGYSGYDEFTYRISCGLHSADAIVSVTVYPPNDTTIIDPSICIGEFYDFHGTLYNQDGQVAYFDTIDNHGCPKVEKLVLSVGDMQMPPILYQNECYESGTTPSWTWEVTGITYHEDTYEEIVRDDPYGGCPIKYRLDLKFHESYYREETLEGCDSIPFNWLGTVRYLKEIDEYEFKTQTAHGCDSTVVVTVSSLESTPRPKIKCSDASIAWPHHPITATEFNVNKYTYHVSDSLSEHTWDESQCGWSISKPSWRIAPSDDNRSCTVFVMDWVEDTVWLTYKAVNPCTDGNGVVARYWLKPSFYDVGEQQENLTDFSVMPNPNNGQMTLRFENLTGKVNVKVYDMKGVLIDDLQVFNDQNSNSWHYDMSGCANGIYCFVVMAKEGIISKKVIVNR